MQVGPFKASKFLEKPNSGFTKIMRSYHTQKNEYTQKRRQEVVWACLLQGLQGKESTRQRSPPRHSESNTLAKARRAPDRDLDPDTQNPTP